MREARKGDERYKGVIGPADAMSALDPRFHVAYAKASAALLEAVLEFERTTGRIVDGIELGYVDITRLADTARRTLRQTSLHFLPKPGEVDW